MTDKTDNLFSSPQAKAPFAFNAQVAEVFPDMIKRSVPGYGLILEQITQFARKYVVAGSHCYDLGCSLGAASLAMSQGIETENCQVIGVDNSKAMLSRCQKHIDAFKHSTPINLLCEDILTTPMSNASMVVLNFTLQFVEANARRDLLKKVYEALLPGGILVLSEKIHFSDPVINDLIIDVHHQFKKDNGYSDLEISQKRNSLENVLVPESMEAHINRLKDIGFRSADCWFQQFNFCSLIAIK